MGVLVAEGEYFVRKLLGKMNAESENKPPSKFHFSLISFSHGFVTGEIKNRAVK